MLKIKKSKSFWTQHADNINVSAFGLARTQSPPPAHQQASPITPVNFLSTISNSKLFCLLILYFLF